MPTTAAMQDLAEFHPSPAATAAELQLAHTREYVDRFMSGELLPKDMRAIGFPWSPSLVARNLASVGGTLAATKALLAQPELLMTAHISGMCWSLVSWCCSRAQSHDQENGHMCRGHAPCICGGGRGLLRV